VRNPYFPVMSDALVGAHAGLTHKLVKVRPEVRMLFKCGVSGFMLPSEKPTIASLPISSAMMSRMFSLDFIRPIGAIGEPLSSLQAVKRTASVSNRVFFMLQHSIPL
jgi:hypothetical protein